MRFENKVAIVTGGANGIGYAISWGLAKEGAKVIIADIASEGAQRAAAALEEAGYTCMAITADVSNEAQVNTMVAAVAETFGTVDILVNNAAARNPGRILEFSVEDWDDLINANVRGTFFAMQEAARYMKEQGYGKIINIASLMGLRPTIPTRVAYSTSKQAIISLTQSAARELGPLGIYVNSIALGSIRTNAPAGTNVIGGVAETMDEARRNTIIAVGRRGVPEELKATAVYLSCHDSDYVDGCCLVVDGGWDCGD